MMLSLRNYTRFAFGAIALASFLGATQIRAIDPKAITGDKESKLIALLQSDAPPADKAMACKLLAIYGSKNAVPALAACLPDANLSSWARIGLEAIPDPSVDAAFRDALGQLQGRLLIGVINSIGVRQDAKAVEGLSQKLKDADMEVASAAAIALGRIGGEAAARILATSLASAPEGLRTEVAQGGVRCAQGFLDQGKYAQAMKLYDAVRQASVPKHRQIEAIRGAILARQADGLPLLLDQLRSSDKDFFGIGLRTARELPGQKVTKALASELDQCSPDRQVYLLLALSDRPDAAVLPAVLARAQQGPKKLRVTALTLLERLGNVTTIPALMAAAVESDPELAQAAKTVLARLPGAEVDADLLGRLPASSGKARQVLIELGGQRRMPEALPIIVKSAEETDAGIRRAAVEAIGAIGESRQAADLARLLQKTQNAKERAPIEKALMELCGRKGKECVPHLRPLTRSSDSDLRIIALQTLAAIGGPDALAMVKAALNDEDETVQEESIQTLSTWPNNWPEDTGVAEPLLVLAKSGKKKSHQVLGLRGYLQYIQADKQLSNDDKIAKMNALLPLMSGPEEKRLAISTLGTVPNAAALAMLGDFTMDAALAEDAYSAMVNLAGQNNVSKELRQQALQTVIEKSNNAATKRRATRLLEGRR